VSAPKSAKDYFQANPGKTCYEVCTALLQSFCCAVSVFPCIPKVLIDAVETLYCRRMAGIEVEEDSFEVLIMLALGSKTLV